MLDEATAAAEAMTLARRTSRSKSPRFVVDADTLPQTIAVLRTRAEPLGIELLVADLDDGLPVGDCFGVLLSYPGASGAVRDHADLVAAAHERDAKVIVATDLLALTLLRPPGEIGVDIAVGSSQRFGVPMGYGGPHAAFMAVRSDAAAAAARAGSSGSAATPTARPPSGSPCRPASSTSAARRRPATSAPRRCCSP